MGDQPRKKDKERKKKPGSKSKPRDIWSQILEVNKQQKRQAGDSKLDTNVLVVGSKGAGKSSMVTRFLNSDDPEITKPTMGLDYVYARRTIQGAKQVAHIWELGGGEDQASLMDAVITPENLRSFVCIVCVDLSKPSTVLDSLVFWLERVRKRIDYCLQRMSEKKSTVPDRLRARAAKEFGMDHSDTEIVNLCPIPVLVTATKFDSFQNEDAEYRKIMGRTLRFLSHINGASLYYVSMREKSLLGQFRSVLSHAFFGVPLSTSASRVVVDHSKALCVRAGADEISGIGAPPRVDGQAVEATTPLELYTQAFTRYFPPQQEVDSVEAMTNDSTKYSEPAIDAMRDEKAELLRRYRAESQQEAKDRR